MFPRPFPVLCPGGPAASWFCREQWAAATALLWARSRDGAAELCLPWSGRRQDGVGRRPCKGQVRASERPGRARGISSCIHHRAPRGYLTSSSPGLRRPQGAGSDLGASFGPWPGTRLSAVYDVTTLVSEDSRHPSQRRSFVPRDVRELGALCVEVQKSTIRAPLETGAAQRGAGSQDTLGARGARAQSCGGVLPRGRDAWSMGKPDPRGRSEVGAGGSTPAGGDPWG